METSKLREMAMESRRYARHIQKQLQTIKDNHPLSELAIDEGLRHIGSVLEWLDEVVDLYKERDGEVDE